MKLDPIRAKVLSVKIIPNVNMELANKLGLNKFEKSVGLITVTIDDVGYAAVDEATKKADVRVIYAKSMYGGYSNASTKLAGEFIAMFSGTNPEDVKAGLNAAIDFVDYGGCFYSANDDDSISFFSHTISRSGSYLSSMANIMQGDPIAYLIAPPLEAIYGLDAALKAAQVSLKTFYGPPTHTNFAGGLLTGTQSACASACDAFKNAVIEIASNPINFRR